MMIIGHRGGRNLWPENSLSGFRELISLGVEGVEFDVQETSDGQLVIIHDPTLERTTLGNGPVCEHTAAEVLNTALRSGQGERGGPPGQCVPALADVLSLFRPTDMELHVEIKTNAIGELKPGTIERVVKAVHDANVAERSILTCFVPEVLDEVLHVWPQARVLASLDHRSAEIMGGLTRALARYTAIPGCLVAVNKALLSAAWDQCLDALGPTRLGVWVPNEPEELAHWMAMPMRQLTTDRPDLALAARH
jgi:glycerophosphoryl diester phosphodiesterase